MAATARRQGVTPYEAPPAELPSTVRELFDALPPLPGLRVEVIEGNLHVSPVGSPEHQGAFADLHDLLFPVRKERGWKGYPGGLDVCVEGPREPVVPDYVLLPPDCPRWGEREMRSSGLIMVAEVVSPSSKHDDRVTKVGLYATGGVPVYLLLDPLERKATVYSDIADGAYQAKDECVLGETLHLPEPVDFDLETTAFKE
ncbi:Uma2 family endonuclease [Nonomuraea sp. NPDC059007]|uniref:Uma2 family endonuclease n=1 Tax=Nonomuraea sp. NPDC059007 TaxID=3346692 RepID=UPI00369051EA